jgi:hypothetical protein
VNEFWSGLFLGVIALSTLVMATIQVGAIVYAARLGRKVERLSEQVEHEIKPLLDNLASISSNALQASNLALVQVERADRMFSDITERLDQTLAVLQATVLAPIREGRAVVAAIRVAVGAFRELRQAARSRAGRMDDEDALFIG